MSFFDETKNAGLALVIIAVISAILGIVTIVLAFTEDPLNKAGIITAIGSIICAIVYFKYGSSVRSGAVSKKIDVLGGFVNAVGIVTIVGGLFQIIAGAIAELENGVANGVISIILGLIIIWCGKKINDGKQTTFDKILWIILLIVFVLSLLGSIFMLLPICIDTITAICYIIVYLFMIALLFDSDVKKEMGM